MNHYIRFIIVWLLHFSVAPTINAQLYINEILASNLETNLDPDYDESSDWIEIYNAGTTSVSLNGYYITDNFNNPNKWKISTLTSIEPGGYGIIWADGFATGLHTSFKLSASGEEVALYSPTLVLVDSVRFHEQKADISFGRLNDGGGDWGYFIDPTPNSRNGSDAFADFVNHKPQFSVKGGIFDASFDVQISNKREGVIRYTLDGSEPNETSAIYVNPIFISDFSVVRARIFVDGLLPGPVVTHSYIVGAEFQSDLPIISIATEPENFWDPIDGIYVQDFKPEWEVPINIELFENDGSDRAAFNEKAGTKINGLYSWQLPQKMLGIYFRKKYGSGSLDYPLFINGDRGSYETFALRASGSDWSYTLFRDVLGHSLANDYMGIDIQKYRPCIVYVNGQYMGIHNIREKIESDYIQQNYQLDGGTFDMVENENMPEAGDLIAYNELLHLLGQDLSVQANFDAVAEVMDIENFTDYFIMEAYSGNTSLLHNVMAWKPKVGGKWKWILMDLDRGFFNPDTKLIDYYAAFDVIPFKELILNDGYKAYFTHRFADYLYTTLNFANVSNMIDYHKAAILNELPRHVDRWLGATSSYGNALSSVNSWSNNVDELKTFAEERTSALLGSLISDYGLSDPASLSINILPQGSGVLTFNGIDLALDSLNGSYPTNMSFELDAKAVAGYFFKGWALASENTLVAKGSTWKYNDSGVFPGSDWNTTSYNDNAWQSGAGELGYGDGDEATEVNRTGATTYFRHSFNVQNNLSSISYLKINLLRDDGAIVYINGKEVQRTNMPAEPTDINTYASSSISGGDESTYKSFLIDKSNLKVGINVVAVEVHQSSANSTDISFDLEMLAGVYNFDNLVSNDSKYSTKLTGDFSIAAIFEATGQCILPEIIDANLVLNKDCSPYIISGITTVSENTTLTIEPGVEIWLSQDAGMVVNGLMDAVGSSEEPIIFKFNPEEGSGNWSNLTFKNTTGTSVLSHVTIQDALKGANRVTENAAISAFNADLIMDYLVLTNNFGNPVHARYSNIKLKNSIIHSAITGDLINVKYGHGEIVNCEFLGNDQPDTDAIDYDDVTDGIIRNCKITNLFGFNSDAIDIGEMAQNVVIDSVWVYNITDKGVSVGQQSTATITNSTFVNCNLGLGLKDSCKVYVEGCNFYNNGTHVSCFEKNIGDAGGNAIVINSILSNASEASFFSDGESRLTIAHSLSDNDTLPVGNNNLFGNPDFVNSVNFQFELQSKSIAKLAGDLNGTPTDMGVALSMTGLVPDLMISHIYIGAIDTTLEFLGIYNPSDTNTDLSAYAITKGVSYVFPDGVVLKAKDTLYVTNNRLHSYWANVYRDVYQWDSGKLSNNGEAIQLENAYGIVLDHVRYNFDGIWPIDMFYNKLASVISAEVDNHFGYNWVAETIDVLLDTKETTVSKVNVYPNPASGWITVESNNAIHKEVEIYSTMGRLLDVIKLNAEVRTYISTDNYRENLLILKIGTEVVKVVVL